MDHYSFILGSNSGNPTAIAAFNTFSRLLVDDIFLNFYNKSYKNLVEKWQIAEAGLKIINRFVSDDTLLGGLVVGSIDASVPRVDTGSRILTHLNQPSELLRLMLHILDEGCSAVESYIKFPGKTNVEKSCLQVLQILRRVLPAGQPKFPWESPIIKRRHNLRIQILAIAWPILNLKP